VQCADVLAAGGHVLALKYAQALYGVDELVYEALGHQSQGHSLRLPSVGEFTLHNGGQGIAAEQVLFVGVPELRRFGYKEIREFGRRVLTVLASAAPETQVVLLTLHGAGYGLDESEAFRSEIAGLIDALSSGDFPSSLTTLTVVERNPGRAERLAEVLTELVPTHRLDPSTGHLLQNLTESRKETLRSVGYDSDSKPSAFVAMPFVEEMGDVFHYGIERAVNAAGYLCERADLAVFTGDIMEWVRTRIGRAQIVIADLSGANANVYLEVGYAWGQSKPTILLVRDSTDLKFDVRSQRCLVYSSIRQLEERLTRELAGLRR
jgi:hypothetical protein